MARNPAHILTTADAARVATNRALLSNRVGQTVTLDFVTRDGEPRTYTGNVEALIGTRKGAASTEAVILELPDGARKSANLWAIKSII